MSEQSRRFLADSFEGEVRRTAEAVWCLSPEECQPEWYQGDPVLHELDGIVRLRDITHLLMATTSTRLDKVKEDVKKLNAAERLEKKRGLPVEKWLITQDQLKAEQVKHAKDSNVKVLTLDAFRRRFFDGRDYVGKRRDGAFGSARNLKDGSISIPANEYVELPMTVWEPVPQNSEKPIDLATIIKSIREGECFVLVGPFGAGKSLTTREIFLELAKSYSKETSICVPVALNLREHWGALYGDEILDRHARSIGFAPRENVTIAWRAGIATLLLDGFDEVASQAIARPSDKNFMRQARYEALQAVRDLVSKLPRGSGLLICGRDHYFDNFQEMIHSLGLTGRRFSLVKLGEFSEQQADDFLRKHYKGGSALPDWLPRKPLILGYLAHQGLLPKILQIDASKGFGFAWDSFLRLVCEREATHDRAVMDVQTIRHVLERLACSVRSSSSGTGPINGLDLAEAYRAETGDTAGEGVLMQLQRLPGLTPREQDPSARSFVDQDLLSALQGSAVAHAIITGSSSMIQGRWLSGLPRDGIRMATHLLREQGFSPSTVIATAKRVAENARSTGDGKQFAMDSFAIALELSEVESGLDGHGLVLAEADLENLDLEEQIVTNVILRECTIQTMTVGMGLTELSLRAERCMISKMNGVQSQDGLPSGVFLNCEFLSFDDASTNAAVLRLDIEPPLKTLLTILRKLYLQAGGGRKLSALKRGLPYGAVFNAVEPVLRILESEGIVVVSNQIAHPIRRYTGRVRQILASGTLSTDSIVQKVKQVR